MGEQYATSPKRPFLVRDALQVNGNSTFTGNVTMSGTLAVTGAVTNSGAVTHSAGYREAFQAMTGASTGTNVTNYGITRIVTTSNTESTSAGTVKFTIANPVEGVIKRIAVQNDTTKLIEIVTVSSSNVFQGTTMNAIQWTTGSTGAPGQVELWGCTDAATWMIGNISSTSIGLVTST